MSYHPCYVNVYKEIMANISPLVSFAGTGLSQLANPCWPKTLFELSVLKTKAKDGGLPFFILLQQSCKQMGCIYK